MKQRGGSGVPDVRMAAWLQRHRIIWRYLMTVRPIREWVARRVWASLLAQPGVRDDLEQSRADFEAHRTYVWDLDTGLVSPDPRWPKDGPQPKPAYFMKRS